MKPLFFGMLVFLFLLPACGDGHRDPVSTISPEAEFVASRQVAFTAAIDPISFEQLETLHFYDSFSISREELHVIATPEDLADLNRTLSIHEQLTYPDLDDATYILWLAPACPAWDEFAALESLNQDLNLYRLTVNRFTLNDVACAAVLDERYSQFRANKHR